MKSMILSKPLKQAALDSGFTQKEIAQKAYLAYTTTNGHFNGYPVTADNAVLYSNAFNNSELTFAISQEMLGLMGLVNGCQVKKDALALNAFQRREARERKEVEAEREIACILGTEINELTEKQKNDLLCHSIELADEILFEVSQLCRQLEMIGMSYMDLMKQKIPYWKEQHWIE
ncbi:hypothetical protein [Enterococcus wangshanyuanii]|uniref:Uncharacterized protein n=1 Tax=Enterococcus wangshanyuanii TaxID=2005703 RepID=A0ABQ1PSA5_9ENTE|nr:hypothetical protein [Enterococcus wangshanyuanii]GGD02360.1 hypothetical protein GCM10011573_34740 [Enterococcus wangshanyuanii]